MSEPDNWKSKVYNGPTSATVTTKSGNGMAKNRPYVPRASLLVLLVILLLLQVPNVKIASTILLLNDKDILP